MANPIFFNPNRALTPNIRAAAGALAYTYRGGTTTGKTVYSDPELTTPLPQPIVANAEGIFPQAFSDKSPTKVVVKTAAGVTLYTIDPVNASTDDQFFADKSALLADATAWPTGTILTVVSAGMAYEVAPSLAADHHEETASCKLYEAGPIFSTRQRLADAVQRGGLVAGATVLAEGQPYVVDSAATGVSSALSDLGVDGARRVDRLENLFLAAHFTDQTDTTIKISVSLDGIHFAHLNTAVLPGASAFSLSQRDPAITYFNGWWWIFGTGGASGNHDFVVYRSRDLSVWSKYQIAMAGGPYFSTTVPMPGGSVPASAIWAPQPFIEDGVMKVLLSIRYGADFTNLYSNTQQHFRPYVSTCTNADTPAFSAPVAMTFGPGYPANVLQWDNATSNKIAPTLPLKHQGSPTAGWAGFEMSLMEHLARAYPNDTILIVPAGMGASGFVDGGWTSGGGARNGFTTRLNAALAASPGATIEGMFWQQGEEDKNNASYSTQLNAFISWVRSSWPALATAPICMGEMGTFVAPGSVDVNAVIASVAGGYGNTVVVQSDDLTDKGDSLHFDANSYRALGDRHYAAWRAARGALPSGSGATRIFVIAGQSNAVGWGPAYTTYDSGTSMIDPSVVAHDGRYYCAIKDSVYRRIRIYSSTSLTGPWTFSQSLGDTAREVEAPCLTRVRDLSAINAETRRDKWRVYVDHNRTGPTDTTPDSLVGQPFFFEAVGTPDADYGDMQRQYFEGPVRHGSVVNLADLPEAAALSLGRVAASSGAGRSNLAKAVALAGGTTWIRPQPEATYYVDATSGAADLTVRDGPADRFYLAVFSGLDSVGITVQAAAFVARGFILGFGRGGDTVVEMRRRVDGQYYPVDSGLRRAEFAAHKGGVAQSAIPAGSEVKVTWPTEAFDLGGYFSGSSLTPPRGRVDLTARILMSGLDAGQNNFVSIKKNGALLAVSYFQGDGGQATGEVSVSGEPCSGTDVFEVFSQGNGTTDKSISGAVHATSFAGIVW